MSSMIVRGKSVITKVNSRHDASVIDDGAVQEHQDRQEHQAVQEHHDKSIGGAVAHANERPPAPPHLPPPPSD